ncbi:Aldolase-type TIM barrel [Penicillium angulare]|uniref:Aldolase-type TIM barrel n=1 Tax=Penicillium angulare TaxID=116970 RepID=UPI0025425F13|nr:Aldolase-type TIM barrel [Penicillium angulare]KAJ5291368.1 Aldolase-type TIM barrel [Penicillium angulare]
MSTTPRFQCADVDPSPLGQPLKFSFSGRSAPNRFLKGAMSERLASFSLVDVESRGIPSPELIHAYKIWGESNIGINLTGNVMIDPGHLEAAGNPVIPQNAEFSGLRFERFRELAAAGKAKGSLIIAQVGHPGRQTPGDIQPNPISASDVQLTSSSLGKGFGKPRPATKEDIANVIDGFAHAAEYLEKAGFDGIELHGAHGYLLSQFLSPTTNLRTDDYGGDLKNRMRLILEVRDEIAKRVSDKFVVGIKVNSVEFQEKGFQPEEAKELCKALEEHKFDFVELSGGTYEKWVQVDAQRQSTVSREAFFLEFARAVVPGLSKTKSYVTGGFKTVEGMIGALDTVDGIGLGRPLCQEPTFCNQILSGQIKGAMLQKLDLEQFSVTAGAAGLQIKQMGQNLQPINLSVQENVAKLFGGLMKWKAEQDKNAEIYQFPALDDYSLAYDGTQVV